MSNKMIKENIFNAQKIFSSFEALEKLSANAYYVHLRLLNSDDRTFKPKLRWIEYILNCSFKTAKKVFNELVDKGFVKIEKSGKSDIWVVKVNTVGYVSSSKQKQKVNYDKELIKDIKELEYLISIEENPEDKLRLEQSLLELRLANAKG